MPGILDRLSVSYFLYYKLPSKIPVTHHRVKMVESVERMETDISVTVPTDTQDGIVKLNQ